MAEDTEEEDREDSLPVAAQNNVWEVFRLFREMAVPFFKEEKEAKILLASVLALTLANSGVSVTFSYLSRDWFNALAAKDLEQFQFQLQKFVGALTVAVPITVYYRFQREKLALAWREWMTNRVMDIYYADNNYYLLESSKDIDNPDQRISEDVKAFTHVSLDFLITVVTACIDLVSFSAILYSIYPQLFYAIIAYAGAGTTVTTSLGRKLVGLNFEQLQKEADFRYSLIRVRENAESIAFYKGEGTELVEIRRRLKSALENFGDIIRQQRNLEFFTVGYKYMVQVVPGFVVAPQYFAGKIELGVIQQSFGSFSHVLNDFSIIINQFEALSKFSAGVDRLGEFVERMQSIPPADGSVRSGGLMDKRSKSKDDEEQKEEVVSSASTSTVNGSVDLLAPEEMKGMPKETPSISTVVSESGSLRAEGLTVLTPSGSRVLVRDVSFELKPAERLLIIGESGTGKSSMLRALAGLWTAGSGTIYRPDSSTVFFLPQRPYCTLGDLRDQVTYPAKADEVEATDDELLALLKDVDLGSLAKIMGDGDPYKGIRSSQDWSDILSLGEQQRLAYARLLYNKPKLAIFDEATSALDLKNEDRMFTLIKERLPDLSIISVGHRPSLLSYHDRKLRLKQGGGYEEESILEVEAKAVVGLSL